VIKGMKVNKVAKLLGVSHVTVYKKLKKFNKELQDKTYKEKGILFLLPEAVTFIKSGIEKNDKNSCVNNSFSRVETLLKEVVTDLKEELKQKNDVINKLIGEHSQERERSDTIIMKLTQNNNLLQNKISGFIEDYSNPLNKKKEVVGCDNTDVSEKISIKSNKEMVCNILQGKSLLQKIYIKLFKPELLRGGV